MAAPSLHCDTEAVQRKRPKDLVLIDARAFAERLSTPTLITDNIGNLVYYNEAAEMLLGRPFSEAGEMPAEQWTEIFTVRRADGSPMPLEEMPGGTALLEHKPAHGKLRIKALDGIEHTIAATGLPIFTGDAQPVGVIALFWKDDG